MTTFVFLLLYTGCNTDATRSLSLLVVVVLIVYVAPLPLLYLRYESFATLILQNNNLPMIEENKEKEQVGPWRTNSARIGLRCTQGVPITARFCVSVLPSNKKIRRSITLWTEVANITVSR